MESNKFDLNIQKILEGWGLKDAVREIIANALDEQYLSHSEPIQIFKDSKYRWHIRDFGRGLKIEHFTQNENSEKRVSARMIGQFGIGLKDAIATFDRKGANVMAKSRYADFTFSRLSKSGYQEIVTLHAIPGTPSDPKMQGTDFILTNCPDDDIEEAKKLFMIFSGNAVIETTKYGDIVDSPGGVASIYINGVKVNEEENFRFSYNITDPDRKIKKALNRERTNVGRTAYSSRVLNILLKCESTAVAKALVEDLKNITKGVEHDEIRWNEVAIHACRLLHSAEKVIFLTADELFNNAFVVDTARQTGFEIITVPTAIKNKLSGLVDFHGKPIRDSTQLLKEYQESFKFNFIDENELTDAEQMVFRRTKEIFTLIGGRPSNVKNILISETMSIDKNSFSECLGVWQSDNNRIIIKREQLRTMSGYAGTLLHEVAHAVSGADDSTREFENELTRLLGLASAQSLLNSNNQSHLASIKRLLK